MVKWYTRKTVKTNGRNNPPGRAETTIFLWKNTVFNYRKKLWSQAGMPS